MKPCVFYSAGDSPATAVAASILKDTYSFLSSPSQEVTHLLLPVPSLASDGSIIGGRDLEEVLAELPRDITIVGGNLRHPKLSSYKTLDLLQNPAYLAHNAKITAHCALGYGLKNLPVILEDCPVLVFGWGRIGKCLARLLRQLGAVVTIAARKESDRAMIEALGYHATAIGAVDAEKFRLIYNTIPHTVLPLGSSKSAKIDLASVPGMEGDDVIHARGLPGKLAPESSGKLIAKTIIHLMEGEENAT